MGDTPHGPGASAEFLHHETPAGSAFQTHSTVVSSQPAGEPQQQAHPSPRHPLPAQMGAGQQQQQHGPSRGGPFDMSGMAGILQQQSAGSRSTPYNSQGQARYNGMGISSPVSVSQFPGQSPVPTQQQYYMAPQPHLPPHFYASPLAAQAQPNLPARTDIAYYPAGVVVGQQQQQHHGPSYYYPQPGPFSGQPHAPPQAQMMLGQYASPIPQPVDPRQYQHPQAGTTHQAAGSSSAPDAGKDVVRGPPRKPRQSGHAIWIGNLPPQTDLMGLVHHVCKEADGLESLFLISKSNCAFANFKDEAASMAAQRKLHDSKFLTVRLVSRLRKSTVEGPTGNTAPTGPAASAPQLDPTPEPSNAREAEGVDAAGKGAPAATSTGGKTTGSPVEGAPAQKDRFFILKSLTVEDIELSVRTNIWATQVHNEVTLNNAFHNSDNVYLVFSANKSGEYFGYARMVSPIIDDPSAAIAFAPKAQPAADVELPKAIPTEATEFAPKGRIIDDSARGTIFWEAERDDQAAEEDGSGGGSVSGGDDGGGGGGSGSGSGEETKAWGKPFRLEWLSTARLPFYRARGLRNPWNSNREVKIARDGTELEPSVGRVLIGLFNRVSQSPAVVGGPGLVPGVHPYPPVARPSFS